MTAVGTRPICPENTVLSVNGLTTSFERNGHVLTAVNAITFNVGAGEVFGLVGESGSGKSLTLRSINGLVRPQANVSGEVLWKGRDLVKLDERALNRIRGREISMIFQEPMSSLNPVITVGQQIEESIAAHLDLDRVMRIKRAVEMLDMVGIPAASSRLGDYPHEFSGGMRQRVVIAIALASRPQMLLADEPTTALDVTIQDQILRLILELARELKMAVILVTHDLGVVAQTCDRVAVMYAGRLVETAPTSELLRNPLHPYTHGLLKSVPEESGKIRTPLYSIPGLPPSLYAVTSGCAFAPRCPLADGQCTQHRPVLTSLDLTHNIACVHPGLIGSQVA